MEINTNISLTDLVRLEKLKERVLLEGEKIINTSTKQLKKQLKARKEIEAFIEKGHR